MKRPWMTSILSALALFALLLFGALYLISPMSQDREYEFENKLIMDQNSLEFVYHWENGDYEAAYVSATQLANHPEFGKSFDPHEKLGDAAVRLERIGEACFHYQTAIENVAFDVEIGSGYFPAEAILIALRKKKAEIGCDE